MNDRMNELMILQRGIKKEQRETELGSENATETYQSHSFASFHLTVRILLIFLAVRNDIRLFLLSCLPQRPPSDEMWKLLHF